jgi:hypothetical protein
MGLVQYSDIGFFAPSKIAEVLRTTGEEVAKTAGLGQTPAGAKTAFGRTKPSAGSAKWSRSQIRSTRASARRL